MPRTNLIGDLRRVALFAVCTRPSRLPPRGRAEQNIFQAAQNAVVEVSGGPLPAAHFAVRRWPARPAAISRKADSDPLHPHFAIQRGVIDEPVAFHHRSPAPFVSGANYHRAL